MTVAATESAMTTTAGAGSVSMTVAATESAMTTTAGAGSALTTTAGARSAPTTGPTTALHTPSFPLLKLAPSSAEAKPHSHQQQFVAHKPCQKSRAKTKLQAQDKRRGTLRVESKALRSLFIYAQTIESLPKISQCDFFFLHKRSIHAFASALEQFILTGRGLAPRAAHAAHTFWSFCKKIHERYCINNTCFLYSFIFSNKSSIGFGIESVYRQLLNGDHL